MDQHAFDQMKILRNNNTIMHGHASRCRCPYSLVTRKSSGREFMVMKMSRVVLCFTLVVLRAQFVNSDTTLENEIEAVLEATPRHTCYGDLGCFGLEYPWVSIKRPFLRLPDNPSNIDTTFYLSTRKNHGSKRKKMTVQPEISLNGTDWDSKRWTIFIAHGFRSSSFKYWVRELESTLLVISDMNVISCDWKKGASGMNYIRAAVNTRVVGAQVARLISFLLQRKLVTTDRIHLIGQSLGAHVMSYVSAKIKNIARLTGLDPAQPGFEGAHPDTRVDSSDAVFVDVIHTNAAHFVTSLGLGMIKPIGHVDFFVNGGKRQPGCWLHKGILGNVASHIQGTLEVFNGVVGCSHERACMYYIEALKSNCSFWGKRLTLSKQQRNQTCNANNCQRMGRYTTTFPARGTFNVQTRDTAPFCISDPITDNIMKFHQSGQLKKKLQDKIFGGI